MKLKLLFFPLSVAIALFLFIYFVKPTWSDYLSSKKLLDQKMADLIETQNNKENLEEISSEFSSIEKESKLLVKNAVPSGISEEEFVYDLNNIMSATGTKLKEVAFSENGLDDNGSINSEVMEVDINAVLMGNYFQLKKALYLIENMNRFVRVDNLNIKEGDVSGGLEMNLGLVAFYKGEEINLQLKSKSAYLSKLLGEGLNLELVEEYQKYRGGGYEFNFSLNDGFGKDNLFGVSGSEDLGIEDEIVSGEEVEANQESEQESVSEETGAVENSVE